MLRFKSPASTLEAIPAADTPVRQVIRCRTCCGPRSSNIWTKPAFDDDVGFSGRFAEPAPVHTGRTEPAHHLRLAALAHLATT
jgi:hypothetical protein